MIIIVTILKILISQAQLKKKKNCAPQYLSKQNATTSNTLDSQVCRKQILQNVRKKAGEIRNTLGRICSCSGYNIWDIIWPSHLVVVFLFFYRIK